MLTDGAGEREATTRREPRVVVGDFSAFYAAEVERTLAVVIALRGPRARAEDVTQEAFARAYQRWAEVGAMARPDLWVQRVALNLATSQLRRLSSETRALLRLGGRHEARSSDDGPLTAGYEDADGFWRLVRRLPSRQARVVALYYAADRPVAEIAEVLGVAEGTVKSHLHAARTRLAELLDEEDRYG